MKCLVLYNVPTGKFNAISNWPGKGPIVQVKFEIKKNDGMIITKTMNFLFDTGNSKGITISCNYIVDYELDPKIDLITRLLDTPGGSGVNVFSIKVTVLEIIIHKINILENPYETFLFFSPNLKQTPIIGQDLFSDFECCVNYKTQKLSINKV